MKIRPLMTSAQKLGFSLLKPTKSIELGDVSKLRLATNPVVKKVGLSRENVLINFCEKYNSKVIKESRKISIDTVTEEYSRISKHLDSTEQEQLLRLIDDNKIQLYERNHILSRTANDEAALNIWLESNEKFSQNLTQFKELLKLEREGKLQGEYVAEILRLTQLAEDPKVLNQFMDALRNGMITPQNIVVGIKRCLDGEPLDFLRILPKVNRVSTTVSTGFINKLDDIANSFKNGKGIDELKEAGGIGLKYSRDEFKTNILKEIENLTPTEQNAILAKFGLENEGLGKISGLPVFNHNTNNFNTIEHKINEEIGKFLYNNELILPKGFESYKSAIESICEAIPEFRFTIGLKQHGGQSHKLAEHLLKVFQENTYNPLYKTLNETDRKVLGISSLLHDIRKIERTRDFGHAHTSSLSVDAILGKMDLSVAEKNRIINMVENHHWLMRIPQNGELNKFEIENLADIFKSGNDFKIAKIFAESDLRAVNSSFFNLYGNKINSPTTKAIEQEITNIQKNGRMIYTADVTMSNALTMGAQKVKLGSGTNLTENIVIDAKDLGLNEKAFGYHSASIENLKRAYASGRHGVSGVFSLSIGKNGMIPTYNKDFPEFLITRALDMDNICFIRPHTSNTKFLKDYTFMSIKSRVDNHFAQGLRKKYKALTQKELSDKQYAQIFRELPRENIEDIHANPKIIETLGGESEAMAFENAVHAQNNVYINKDNFSEAVAGDLEWGALGTKRKELSEIPFELRKFAQDNNILFIKFD